MMRELFRKMFRREHKTYSEEEKQKLAAKKAEAITAVKISEGQELRARNIRRESEKVGEQMRKHYQENHFAARVRKSFLEGR
jgi:hypothetical protein